VPRLSWPRHAAAISALAFATQPGTREGRTLASCEVVSRQRAIVDLFSKTPYWMNRVRAAAERRGISMADFVIMTVSERLDADAGQGEPAPAKKKSKRKS